MTLYIVPTPIGNIKDITIRAIDVLKSQKVFLCEDTRVTRKLFSMLEIDSSDKKFLAYFEHNERAKVAEVIEMLKSGQDLVLVTDAGTPLISDPGFPLIREIRKINDPNFKIVVLPGATSVTTALASSGFPTDKFTFLGYFPRKPADKKKLLKSLVSSHQYLKSTYVSFETMVRIKSTLELMKAILGNDIEVCLCRELTKKFESVDCYPIDDAIKKFSTKSSTQKGELVLIFRFL